MPSPFYYAVLPGVYYYVGIVASISIRQVLQGSPGDAKLVEFQLYYRSNTTQKEVLILDEHNIPPEFSKEKKLTVWIHGFGDGPDEPGYGNVLVEGYLNSSVKTNLIAVDWTKLFSEGYDSSVYEFFLAYFRVVKWNVPVVAERISAFLLYLVENGLSAPDRIHLIGFSTGAHVAGHAAHVFKSNSGTNLSRVTGLDPVGLAFEFPRVGEHKLGKEDAEFVDIFHTNIFFQGAIFPMGDLDVYVNNAISQPDCPSISFDIIEWSNCPHSFSIKLYAKTLTNDFYAERWSWCKVFPAWICGNDTAEQDKIAVGYPCSNENRGVFRIWTENQGQ